MTVLQMARVALQKRLNQQDLTVKRLAEQHGIRPNTGQQIVRRYIGTGKTPRFEGSIAARFIRILDAQIQIGADETDI